MRTISVNFTSLVNYECGAATYNQLAMTILIACMVHLASGLYINNISPKIENIDPSPLLVNINSFSTNVIHEFSNSKK